MLPIPNDPQPSEHGMEWWLRYVLIPLIGTGSVTAVGRDFANRNRHIPHVACERL